MGIEGKLLVSRKNIVVNKESIGIDNDLTKDRNVNTFKTYCKRRKSGARFPDRKANNRLCACHCIAGNVNLLLSGVYFPGIFSVANFGATHRARRLPYVQSSSSVMKHQYWKVEKPAGKD